MFEDLTFDNIMEEMMEDAEQGVSVIEGSFYWSACAKIAMEIERLAPRLETLNNNMKIDTMEEDVLIAGGKECGLPIEEAEAAVFLAQFNCAVAENARFSHIEQEYNYYVLEVVDEAEHIYKVECEEVGLQPSFYLGEIEPVSTDDEPEAFEWGRLIEVFYPGKDQESIEDYRFRRQEHFGIKAFAGNRKYYKQEIGALVGVGAVKINRRQLGEETLIAVIASETFTAPTEQVVREIQEMVDPTKLRGDGTGIAPVEHVITVTAVDEFVVGLETSITTEEGLNPLDYMVQIERVFEEYIKEVAQKWEDASRLTIVISQIEARIINIEGIIDVYSTKLNGLEQNLILGEYELPKKGGITLV